MTIKGVELRPRELAALQLIADGLSNREIADALGIGEQATKNLIWKACQRTGADNRTHLIAQAFRQKIIR
jgi:DNA-binding CsgD family transcriptional regulator